MSYYSASNLRMRLSGILPDRIDALQATYLDLLSA